MCSCICIVRLAPPPRYLQFTVSQGGAVSIEIPRTSHASSIILTNREHGSTSASINPVSSVDAIICLAELCRPIFSSMAATQTDAQVAELCRLAFEAEHYSRFQEAFDQHGKAITALNK